MLEIDWLAEIGGKRPTEDRLWHAWKRAMIRAWQADEQNLTRQVHIWRGNHRRRSADGQLPPRENYGPWYAGWPGWEDILGPRPDKGDGYDQIVSAWYAARPHEKTPRASLGRSQRFAILERDGFRCRYCGRAAPDVVLHVDHIHPKSRGGTDDDSNLGASCVDCNFGKRDRVLD